MALSGSRDLAVAFSIFVSLMSMGGLGATFGEAGLGGDGRPCISRWLNFAPGQTCEAEARLLLGAGALPGLSQALLRHNTEEKMDVIGMYRHREGSISNALNAFCVQYVCVFFYFCRFLLNSGQALGKDLFEELYMPRPLIQQAG